MKASPLESLAPLRKRIDVINGQLLHLLNQRVKLAKKIGRIKAKYQAPVSDLKREKAIRDSLQKKNKGPMDAPAVEAIFRTIIRETKRLERMAHREPNA